MHTETFSQTTPTSSLTGNTQVQAFPLPEGCQAQGAARKVLSEKDREVLILEHLSTVRMVAHQVHSRLPRHMDLDDLISAGLVGLIDAASKFDQTRQVQFKSYAQFRIRGAMLDSLRGLDWSPRELRRRGRAMAEAIRSLSSKLGRAPSDAEIACELGMDIFTYQHMLGELKGLQLGSLNAERSDDSGDEELDFLPAPEGESPLSLCLEGETREQLAAALESLPEKERLVLTLYYFEELTMKEIGLTLGVVESRVSQIRTSALGRLRKLLRPAPASLSACKVRSRMN